MKSEVITPLFFELGKQIGCPAYTIFSFINNGGLIRKNAGNIFTKFMARYFLVAFKGNVHKLLCHTFGHQVYIGRTNGPGYCTPV
ncbi:hypothetical protein D3C86_1788870 [compost metagenome]